MVRSAKYAIAAFGNPINTVSGTGRNVIDRPRSRVRLRIVDRDLDFKVSETTPCELLRNAQRSARLTP